MSMKKPGIYSAIALLAALFAFSSCEDVIDVELDESKPQLVVDAFLNNMPEKQQIMLSVSQPYFESADIVAAEGASVVVSGPNGESYTFVETEKGIYEWTPAEGEELNEIGGTYSLAVSYGSQSYEAVTTLNPVPPIDSIHFEFFEEELGTEEGYYAEFYARDLAGQDDYYWITSFLNDTLVQDEDFSLAVNAAFGGDGGGDGFVLIPPIRFSITPDDPLRNNSNMKVELKGISRGAWNFLSDVNSQGSGGNPFEVLFSPPEANVRTNLVNADKSSDVKAVGYFEVSSVSKAERTLVIE